jgi:hypothetical protein
MYLFENKKRTITFFQTNSKNKLNKKFHNVVFDSIMKG